MRPFIEEHHYSKSINGCKVSMAFALYEAGRWSVRCCSGPLSTTAWKRYGERRAMWLSFGGWFALIGARITRSRGLLRSA